MGVSVTYEHIFEALTRKDAPKGTSTSSFSQQTVSFGSGGKHKKKSNVNRPISSQSTSNPHFGQTPPLLWQIRTIIQDRWHFYHHKRITIYQKKLKTDKMRMKWSTKLLLIMYKTHAYLLYHRYRLLRLECPLRWGLVHSITWFLRPSLERLRPRLCLDESSLKRESLLLLLVLVSQKDHLRQSLRWQLACWRLPWRTEPLIAPSIALLDILSCPIICTSVLIGCRSWCYLGIVVKGSPPAWTWAGSLFALSANGDGL